MPINTRNIIIDDAEEPNGERPPRRPDYRAAEWRAPARASTPRRLNPYITILVLVIGLPIGGALAFGLVKLVQYIGDVNYSVSIVDTTLLLIVKWSLTLGFVALITLAVCLVAVMVLHRATIRLPNGMPVSVLQLIIGWRNANAADRAFRTLDQHYSVQGLWAQHSDLWSLNTLDMSTSSRLDPRATLTPAHTPVLDAPVQTQALPALQNDELMIERLLKSGLIDRSGNSLLLGFSGPNDPHYIELDETSLIALAGAPRTGKSSTATLLLAQLVLIRDSIIIVCDKHGKKADGLLNRVNAIKHCFARAAIEPSEIVQAIDFWHEIGSNRLIDGTDRLYPPCFLIIDEFTAMILLDLLPPASLHKLISGAIEFPKVQTHGCLIGHQWTGRLLGALGAPTRRVTTQRVVHRIDPQDAEFLLPPAVARQAMSLPNGAALFMGASQPAPIELRIPFFGTRDLDHLARLLPGNTGAYTSPIRPAVAGVASVADVSASASAASEWDTNSDQMLPDPPDAEDVSMGDWERDERTKVAKSLLSKQSSNGKWSFSYRDIQALTRLRTATIVAIAASIGRGAGKQ